MITPELRAALAPNGTLRVGINHGNPVLANRDPKSGELHGIAVDLARELGRRAELPVDLVPFESAGKMSDAATTGVWDVAFLAIDPNRAEQIDFATPYVEIDGAYMALTDSRFHGNDNVDRAGIRIGVSGKSAYDLFLSRAIKHAELVRAASPQTSIDLIVSGKVDVLAGARQHLEWEAAKNSNWRVFNERFMTILHPVREVQSRGETVPDLAALI